MNLLYSKLLTISLIVLSLFSLAQNKNQIQDSVDILPVWKLDEIKNIVIKTTTTDFIDNKKSEKKSQFDAHFKIIKVDEKGYDVEWMYTKATIPANGDYLVENNILSKLLNQKILIRVSDIGKFVELINKEELEKKLLPIVEEFIAKEKDPQMKAQYQVMKAMLTAKDGVKIAILKQISFYYFSFGYHAKLNKKHYNDVKMPNPFGGDLFSAKEVVEMTQLSANHSSLTMETQKQASGEHVKKAFIDFIHKTKPDKAKQITDSLKKYFFEISEKSKHIIDLKNNTVTKGTFERIINIGIHNRKTVWEIETV